MCVPTAGSTHIIIPIYGTRVQVRILFHTHQTIIKYSVIHYHVYEDPSIWRRTIYYKGEDIMAKVI